MLFDDSRLTADNASPSADCPCQAKTNPWILSKRYNQQSRETQLYSHTWEAATAGGPSVVHERGLVHARPLVQYPPKVRHYRFVDVPAVRVDLQCGTTSAIRDVTGAASAALRTFSSVTFQSLIFVLGGSFVHVK